jgi:hypothetical protein
MYFDTFIQFTVEVTIAETGESIQLPVYLR